MPPFPTVELTLRIYGNFFWIFPVSQKEITGAAAGAVSCDVLLQNNFISLQGFLIGIAEEFRIQYPAAVPDDTG